MKYILIGLFLILALVGCKSSSYIKNEEIIRQKGYLIFDGDQKLFVPTREKPSSNFMESFYSEFLKKGIYVHNWFNTVDFKLLKEKAHFERVEHKYFESSHQQLLGIIPVKIKYRQEISQKPPELLAFNYIIQEKEREVLFVCYVKKVIVHKIIPLY